MQAIKYFLTVSLPFILAFIRFNININIPAIQYVNGTSLFAISAIFSAFLGFFGEGFKNYFNHKNINRIFNIIFIYYFLSLTTLISIFFNNNLPGIIIFYTISGALTLLAKVVNLNLGKTNQSFITSQLYSFQLSIRYFSIVFSNNYYLIIILSLSNLICITYQIISLYLCLRKDKIINLSQYRFISLYKNIAEVRLNGFKKNIKFLSIIIYPSILYIFSKYIEYSDKLFCLIKICDLQVLEYIRLFSILISIFLIASEYLNSFIRSGKSLNKNNVEIKTIVYASLIISIFALIFVYFKLGINFGFYTYLLLSIIACLNSLSYLKFIYSFTNYKNERKSLLIFGLFGCLFSIPILFSKFPFIAPITVLITANLGLFLKNKLRFSKI